MSFKSTTSIISQYDPGELVHIITKEEIAYTSKKKKKNARFCYSMLAEAQRTCTGVDSMGVSKQFFGNISTKLVLRMKRKQKAGTLT